MAGRKKAAAASTSTRWSSSRCVPLFGGDEVHWYTPTNATLWMALTVLAVSLLMIAGSRGRALVPSRMQSIAESIYGFVHKMIVDITGKEGAKYFPYIITLFLFILFANLLALIPTAFAPTSHIAVTAILALAVFITVTAIGFYKHGAALPEALLGRERADGGAAHRARASSRSSPTSCARSAIPSDLPAT